MPDLISVLTKRGKLIFILTLAATLLALIISVLRPKLYLSTVTALPANSATADKARIYNSNIEALYSELGSPDELDRIEGTSKLDTLYLFVADKFKLADHYNIKEDSKNALLNAATLLKKATDIRRSAYGELKIIVWDKDAVMAAQLANALFQKLNEIHQHLQSANNKRIHCQLKAGLIQKQQQLDSLEETVSSYKGASTMLPGQPIIIDDTLKFPGRKKLVNTTQLQEQVNEYQKIINQYELSLGTTPQPLIAVEYARPSVITDRPNTFQMVLFAFGGSLVLSVLLAVFAESGNREL